MYQPKVTRLFAFALLVSLPLFLANCGGKGDGDATPNSIEGSWKITAMKLDPGIDAGPPVGKVTDLLAFFTLYTQSTCLSDITFTFKNDGTMVSDNPASCKASATAIEDQTGIDVSGVSKWSLTGDQLTVTNPDGTKQVTTAKISGNTMSWSYKDTVDDLNGKPTPQTITFEYKRV